MIKCVRCTSFLNGITGMLGSNSYISGTRTAIMKAISPSTLWASGPHEVKTKSEHENIIIQFQIIFYQGVFKFIAFSSSIIFNCFQFQSMIYFQIHVHFVSEYFQFPSTLNLHADVHLISEYFHSQSRLGLQVDLYLIFNFKVSFQFQSTLEWCYINLKLPY